MSTKIIKSYNPTFDLLRLGAAIGIILVHVSWWYAYSSHVWTTIWYVCTAINSLSRRCVPIFFMLSGILLLNLDKEDEEISSFYKKKARRIVVPYVLWNAIYYLIWRSRSQTGIIGWIKTFMIQLLSNGVYPYHLWFLSALIGMYLLVPFLRVLLRHITKDQLLRLNLGFIIFSSINTWIEMRSWRWYKALWFTPSLLTWLTGYMILWYSLRNYRTVLDDIKQKYFIAGYAAIAWLIWYLTRTVSIVKGVNNDSMYENGHLWVIAISITVLMIVKLNQKKIAEVISWTRASWLRNAASLTFGVYIIHLLMIKIIASKYVINHFFWGSLSFLHYIVCIIGVIIASFWIVALVHRIPKWDWLIPRS